MIGTLLRLPFIAIGLLVILWVLLILQNPGAPLVSHLEALGFEEAFSHDSTRETILRAAWAQSDWMSRALETHLGARADHLRAPLGLAWLNVEVSRRIFPPFLPLLLAAILAGTAFRERIRRGEGYASPAAAYLARHFFALGILFVCSFALAPLPLPIWTLHLALTVASFGGFLYVSNLPISL